MIRRDRSSASDSRSKRRCTKSKEKRNVMEEDFKQVIKLELPADSMCCRRSKSEPFIGKYRVSGRCLSPWGLVLFLLEMSPKSILISLTSDIGRGESASLDPDRI